MFKIVYLKLTMVVGIKFCSYFVVTIHDICIVIFHAECFVLLHYYFSKFCAVPNRAVFCSSLISCFSGVLLLLLLLLKSKGIPVIN